MESHGLVEPFETEDLAGTDAEFAFALGVEWAMFRQRLKTEERFTDLVIAQGADRLVRMAERNGRFVEHHPYCDGWTKIIVGDYLV